MARVIFSIFLTVWGTTVTAADEDALSLIERGAAMLMQDFLDEIDPEFEKFQDQAAAFADLANDLLAQIGPGFTDLYERIDDISNYEAPEVLPNGDIIIRRKPDAPKMPNSIDL